MRISDTTRQLTRGIAVALVSLVGCYGLGAAAASAQSLSRDTYEWSARLISFDSETGTAVLQARIESYADITGLDEFADGDRLTLVWTGRNWAAGVRDLARDPELSEHALSLPVEFVATENDGQYLNFRVPVPAASVDAIAALDAGMRVTGISPKSPAEWGQGIRTLRHYNDIS